MAPQCAKIMTAVYMPITPLSLSYRTSQKVPVTQPIRKHLLTLMIKHFESRAKFDKAPRRRLWPQIAPTISAAVNTLRIEKLQDPPLFILTYRHIVMLFAIIEIPREMRSFDIHKYDGERNTEVIYKSNCARSRG